MSAQVVGETSIDELLGVVPELVCVGRLEDPFLTRLSCFGHALVPLVLVLKTGSVAVNVNDFHICNINLKLVINYVQCRGAEWDYTSPAGCIVYSLAKIYHDWRNMYNVVPSAERNKQTLTLATLKKGQASVEA